MKQNVRLTKKDLKQDKFAAAMLVTKDYVVQNWMYVVGGIVAVFIIIIGVTFMKSEGSKKSGEGAQTYNLAMGEFMNKSYQQAIVGLKVVIDEFGSTTYGEQARFNLGNAYFESRNYTEAQTAFESYLKKYGDKDKYFTTSAMAGIAQCRAALGFPGEAADKFRETAEKYKDFKLAGQYYVNAMDYYIKSGNLESARVIFAKITKDFENTPYYKDAALIAGENNIEL